jgi:hypothetical protein
LDVARRQFLRLPAPTRARLLAVAGRRSPWDPHFDHQAAPEVPGTTVGPPDFVGIGVQKAGTTWWHSLLARHPEVYSHPGVHKERHFFSAYANREFTDADISAYHRWFPRPAGKMVGEWTPDYLYQDWVPQMLHRAAPNAKLLVILRDPLERYRSGCAHQLEYTGRLTAADVTDAYRRGFYAEDLERYESLFGADAILVLQYEQCRADPAGQLARTLRFLGLDDSWRPDNLTSAVNRTERSDFAVAESRKLELREHYRSDRMQLAKRYPQLGSTRWEEAQ